MACKQVFADVAEAAYMLALPGAALTLVAYTLLWVQAGREARVAARPAEQKPW
jgi:hypothetical protein